MRRATKVLAGVLVVALGAAGCGDDDDDAAPASGEPAGHDSAYCEMVRTIDEQEGFPTKDQLLTLQAEAPDELADEVDVVIGKMVPALEAGDMFAAFEDPAVEAAFEVIDPYEQEVCGLEPDGDEDEPDQDPSVTQLDPAAARVDVTATDFAFALDPAAPAAGRTSFVMQNAGAERHVMFLVQLEPGADFQAALESDGDEGVVDEWESESVVAGGEAVLTTDLVPADYGLLCYIPSADGTPHFAKGMQTEFTVS